MTRAEVEMTRLLADEHAGNERALLQRFGH